MIKRLPLLLLLTCIHPTATLLAGEDGLLEKYNIVWDSPSKDYNGSMPIGNGDIGAAVESAMRDANVPHHAEMAANAVICAAAEYERPSVLFRPKLSIDGNQWCALYGDNPQDGVAGFGDSPTKAMWDFDRAWQKDLPSNAIVSGLPRTEV